MEHGVELAVERFPVLKGGGRVKGGRGNSRMVVGVLGRDSVVKIEACSERGQQSDNWAACQPAEAAEAFWLVLQGSNL